MLMTASLDMFDKVIGKEVFIIGGDYKGYRGTLLSIGPEFCMVAVHAHLRLTLKRHDVVTR
jgi:transcription elongation factor